VSFIDFENEVCRCPAVLTDEATDATPCIYSLEGPVLAITDAVRQADETSHQLPVECPVQATLRVLCPTTGRDQEV